MPVAQSEQLIRVGKSLVEDALNTIEKSPRINNESPIVNASLRLMFLEAKDEQYYKDIRLGLIKLREAVSVDDSFDTRVALALTLAKVAGTYCQAACFGGEKPTSPYTERIEEFCAESINVIDNVYARYILAKLHSARCQYADAISEFNHAAKLEMDPELALTCAKEASRLEADGKTTNVSQAKGVCYIATACYGSYDHPDVRVFRRFRDQTLLPTTFGRLFVATYYKLSPPVAARLGHMAWLSGLIRRWFLEPLARRLK